MVDEEETREVSALGAWIFVVALCALLVGWGLVNYALVREVPRQWDFGVQPDTPGQSASSTAQPPSPTSVPAQILRLPEAATQPASGLREGSQ